MKKWIAKLAFKKNQSYHNEIEARTPGTALMLIVLEALDAGLIESEDQIFSVGLKSIV